jgi:hypothetical protein
MECPFEEKMAALTAELKAQMQDRGGGFFMAEKLLNHPGLQAVAVSFFNHEFREFSRIIFRIIDHN